MEVAELNQLFDDCRRAYRTGPYAHHELEPLNPPADPGHIALAEEQLGVTFTEELTNLYLTIDGGRPIPAFHEFPGVDPTSELDRVVEGAGHGSTLVQRTNWTRNFVTDELLPDHQTDPEYPLDFEFIELTNESHTLVLYQLSGANRGAVVRIQIASTGISSLLAPSLDNLLRAVRDCYVEFGEFAHTPETEDIRRRYRIGDPPAP